MSCQRAKRAAGIWTVMKELPDGAVEVCTGITVWRKTTISRLELDLSKVNLMDKVELDQTEDVRRVLRRALEGN